MSLNISVSSQSSDPALIVPIVNSSQSSKTRHAIYPDMFPEANKVYDCAEEGSQLDLQDCYSSIYPVLEVRETDKDAGIHLQAAPTSLVQATTAHPDNPVDNQTGISQIFGIPDAHGAPYLGINTRDIDTFPGTGV